MGEAWPDWKTRKTGLDKSGLIKMDIQQKRIYIRIWKNMNMR